MWYKGDHLGVHICFIRQQVNYNVLLKIRVTDVIDHRWSNNDAKRKWVWSGSIAHDPVLVWLEECFERVYYSLISFLVPFSMSIADGNSERGLHSTYLPFMAALLNDLPVWHYNGGGWWWVSVATGWVKMVNLLPNDIVLNYWDIEKERVCVTSSRGLRHKDGERNQAKRPKKNLSLIGLKNELPSISLLPGKSNIMVLCCVNPYSSSQLPSAYWYNDSFHHHHPLKQQCTIHHPKRLNYQCV